MFPAPWLFPATDGQRTHVARNELFLSQPSPNVEASHARPYQVRFGSKADIATSPTKFRFTPKADIGTQQRNVRFVPKADISSVSKMTPQGHCRRSSGGECP